VRDLKYYDWGDTVSVAIAGGLGYISKPLNAPVVGTDQTNRIGKHAITKSLLLRFSVAVTIPGGSPLTVSQGEIGRLLVFVDKQGNATNPRVQDVLVVSATNQALQSNFLDNRDRFVILVDKLLAFNPFNATITNGEIDAGAPSIRSGKIYKKLNLEVMFGTTNALSPGLFSDIQTGGMYLMYCPNQYDQTLRFMSRTRHIDNI